MYELDFLDSLITLAKSKDLKNPAIAGRILRLALTYQMWKDSLPYGASWSKATFTISFFLTSQVITHGFPSCLRVGFFASLKPSHSRGRWGRVTCPSIRRLRAGVSSRTANNWEINFKISSESYFNENVIQPATLVSNFGNRFPQKKIAGSLSSLK